MLYPDEVESPSPSWKQLAAPVPAAMIVFFELKVLGSPLLVSILESRTEPDPAPDTALPAIVAPTADPVGGVAKNHTMTPPPPVADPSPLWAAVAVALFPLTVARSRVKWLFPPAR